MNFLYLSSHLYFHAKYSSINKIETNLCLIGNSRVLLLQTSSKKTKVVFLNIGFRTFYFKMKSFIFAILCWAGWEQSGPEVTKQQSNINFYPWNGNKTHYMREGVTIHEDSLMPNLFQATSFLSTRLNFKYW